MKRSLRELSFSRIRRLLTRGTPTAWAVVLLICGVASPHLARAEDYVNVPMPPQLKVEQTLLEGPVFATFEGKTLYRWEAQSPGKAGNPVCDSTHYRTTRADALSGGEGGLVLPEADKRPSCEDIWPPAQASADAQPIDSWTIVTRPDGSRQWAYEGYPLYTYGRDRSPGEVHGGTGRIPGYGYRRGRTGVEDRTPISPPPLVPPGITVVTTALGRLLTTDKQMSVYTFDRDRAGRSLCTDDCALLWSPIIAPVFAKVGRGWSLVDRGGGIKQWAFQGKPLYTFKPDRRRRGLSGEDIPGWHGTYLEKAPKYPPAVTVHDTSMGPVLADRHGKTLYVFACLEPAIDMLSCDHPADTQVYRLALCGNGDGATCLKTWPMVPALPGDKTLNWVWSVIEIDPETGHYAAPGRRDALRVWAYRGRPVYTFSGDKQPGDDRGDGVAGGVGQSIMFTALKLRHDLNQSFGED
jgi:predicted lipoprotein with Yx(FWY)xxD motif